MLKPAFAISIVAALALAAGIVALNVLRPGPDNGRIEAKCGPTASGELRWSASRLPVQVLVDPSAGEWTGALLDAAKTINGAARREVVRVEPATSTAWVAFADALAGVGAEPVGRVIVYVGEEPLLVGHRLTAIEHPWGVTRLRWDPATCAIGYGVVWLRGPPSEVATAVAGEVALHEIGHVLGLAHDGLTRSVMVRDLTAPEPGEGPRFPHTLTEHDAALIAEPTL